MPHFEQTHETTVEAPAAKVHALVNDFREWTAWSPWEEKDPDVERTYSGPADGTGSAYAWTGNKAVGSGKMRIARSTPEQIEIELEFIKPFMARNDVRFTFASAGDGTRVSWTLSGDRNLLMHLAGRLFVDKEVGKDTKRGLSKLKAAAERQ